ncbi:MAG TPA: hypothetical protein VH165_08135 [Kofleriaceae bacterium]|nr:hypothetical protein [Kofleriaceae bacterium]
MKTTQATRLLSIGCIATSFAALAGCATANGDLDPIDEDATLQTGKLVAVSLPSGALQSSTVEIADDSGLRAAVTSHDNVYIHDQAAGAWYYKSGNYLLGIESFTQYSQEFDRWVDFGSGDKVAPMQTRVVGSSPDGAGWDLPSDHAGQWPVRGNSVWVIGTEDGRFGMGGAPQGIPEGTEAFGSMQTYGGTLSTPYLEFDSSPNDDSSRIRGKFSFNANTLLGGHSAGSTAARRIALDVGLNHVWLYGTPNYSRGNGSFQTTEKNGSHTMVAEVINNPSDPVTHVLTSPWSLVSLAWGTAKCHDYSHWNYQHTSPVSQVCN